MNVCQKIWLKTTNVGQQYYRKSTVMKHHTVNSANSCWEISVWTTVSGGFNEPCHAASVAKIYIAKCLDYSSVLFV